jgi:hypothetical protein
MSGHTRLMPFLCSKPIIGRSKISLPDMRAPGIFAPSIWLAEQVFTELELHAQLEENVFYSAYEAMTGKKGRQLVADSRLAHKHVRELMSCGCPPSASGPPPQKGLEVTVWLLDSLRAGSL